MKIVLDAFYEIDITEELDEDMAKEILATAQYFQAPFLKKKAMDIFMSKFFVDTDEKKTEIFDFTKKFQIVELEKILEEMKEFKGWLPMSYKNLVKNNMQWYLRKGDTSSPNRD